MPTDPHVPSGAQASRAGMDLAILGGDPAFPAPLHVGRPNMGAPADFMARVHGIFERRWLTNDGPLVNELETRLSDMLGVRHCIAVANGTIGLELAIRALGMTGEVIVPSFTFIATAHALQWQDITPIFCDIRRETHLLDPDAVEKMITPRTTGIIGVHLWGQPCEVEALDAIARTRGLRLLFDAAHAFGCSHGTRMIGSFGEAEVFSFHATKIFGTAEGGAITTNDDELARRCRLMRNFGFVWYDQVDYIGTNGKMSELSAAMGLTNLDALETFVAANRRNYECYRNALADLPGIRLVEHSLQERRNYHNIVIEVDERACGLSRDLLMRVLRADNVWARRYFWPGCHRMEPYRSFFPHAALVLPETERVANCVLSLPTGTAISENDVTVICGVIRRAIGRADALKAHLT